VILEGEITTFQGYLKRQVRTSTERDEQGVVLILLAGDRVAKIFVVAGGLNCEPGTTTQYCALLLAGGICNTHHMDEILDRPKSNWTALTAVYQGFKGLTR
jgi:hypothetical protein